MDKAKFSSLVRQLYQTTAELEAMFPGRHFTPDGHMVGSIGECLVADAYDLTLMTASNKGFDAVDSLGRCIEIKATQAKSVAFRSEPDYAIVIKITPSGEFEEIYNGRGDMIWKQFQGRKLPSNGQYQISLKKLLALNKLVPSSDKILRVK